MIYFIYNAADGCLWLEMPYIPESSFQNRYDAANYHRSYNSRLHYQCSDELKSMLKDGQRMGEDEFDYRKIRLARGSAYQVSGSTEIRQADKDEYGYFYIEAIPKPEQKPNIAVIGAGEPSLKEERMFSLKEMIDCWDASEDFSNECFCGSCDYCTEVPIDVRAKDKHKYFKNKFNISI